MLPVGDAVAGAAGLAARCVGKEASCVSAGGAPAAAVSLAGLRGAGAAARTGAGCAASGAGSFSDDSAGSGSVTAVGSGWVTAGSDGGGDS